MYSQNIIIICSTEDLLVLFKFVSCLHIHAQVNPYLCILDDGNLIWLCCLEVEQLGLDDILRMKVYYWKNVTLW